MLSDVKVLDFSTLLPGPYASMMLADLGAQVLRIEAPDRVDLVREMAPLFGGTSAAHQYLNRSKHSIALDLKKPEAIELVHQLVAEQDIVLEQFRPGVMDRLGLGYDQLKAINPRLIYCAITGYGQTGPYRDRAGHDLNYLSLAGVASYSRRADSPPVPLGIQVADVAGGSLHAVTGILAALHHRSRTGEGQFVDISMTDAAFALNGMSGAGCLAGDVEPKPEGELLNGGTFYDYYETRDGRYFSVGSLEPKFFGALFDLIGQPELKQLADFPAAQGQLKESLASVFRQKTFAEWQAIFAAEDICVEPVLTLREAAQHPQLQARRMVVDVQHPTKGMQKQIGCPIKFSAYEPDYRETGGAVGAQGYTVLSALGLTADDIAVLEENGVVKL